MEILQKFSNSINLPIKKFLDITINGNKASFGSYDGLIRDEGDSYHITSRIVAPALLVKYLGHEKKIDALFSTYSWFSGMTFNKFFTFEVIKLLETISMKKHRYDCDLRKIDAVLEYLKKEVREHEEDIDKKYIDKVFEYKILPHQEQAIKKYIDFKHLMGYRGMLFHGAAGSGKSAAACFIMEGLHNEVEKVIMLCPLPTLYDVWDKTLSGKPGTAFKQSQSRYIVREGKPYKDEKYILCHYEGLEKLMDIIHKLPKGKTAVVIDESHNLNDMKSKRTQLAISLINKIESNNVLLLSGTPVKSGFRELGAIFTFLDDKFSGDIEKAYYTLYASPTKFLQETLLERYNGYTTVVKKEVLKLDPVETVNLKLQLPESKVEPFYLSNIQKDLREYVKTRLKEIEDNREYWNKTYHELKEKGINAHKVSSRDINKYEEAVELIKRTTPRMYKDIPDELVFANKFEREEILPYLSTKEEKDIFKEAKTIYKYPALKVRGEALGNVIGKARINCHAMMAECIDYTPIIVGTRKKTIIFSNYVDVCNKAMATTKKIGFSPIGVYGEDTKNLVSSVDAFDKKLQVNPLVTTYKSLSTGVPLIMADTIICIDLPFRMYQYEQAIARAWRLGQDSVVRVYIAEIDAKEPTINSRNIDIISFFNEEVEKITGVSASLNIKGDETIFMGEEDLSKEEYVDLIDTPDIDNLTVSTEASNNSKRKAVEDMIISYISRIVTGKENVELYKNMFAKMSDRDFDDFMNKLKNRQATLSVIIPTNSKTIKVDVENNIKLAKELGYEFFQRLIVGKTDDAPAYTTPNKYMVLKLPVRRAAQLLSKKISIPENNRHIDSMSGQVTGKSKGAKITNPELQILLGLNLKDSIKELIKVRGGDDGAAAAMNTSLFKSGMSTQAMAEEFSTGVTSKKTLKAYFNSMHVRNTL